MTFLLPGALFSPSGVPFIAWCFLQTHRRIAALEEVMKRLPALDSASSSSSARARHRPCIRKRRWTESRSNSSQVKAKHPTSTSIQLQLSQRLTGQRRALAFQNGHGAKDSVIVRPVLDRPRVCIPPGSSAIIQGRGQAHAHELVVQARAVVSFRRYWPSGVRFLRWSRVPSLRHDLELVQIFWS